MPDYHRTIRLLRQKADHPATGDNERRMLNEKIKELEDKYGKPGAFTFTTPAYVHGSPKQKEREQDIWDWEPRHPNSSGFDMDDIYEWLYDEE
jgi:hypothetical protein